METAYGAQAWTIRQCAGEYRAALQVRQRGRGVVHVSPAPGMPRIRIQAASAWLKLLAFESLRDRVWSFELRLDATRREPANLDAVRETGVAVTEIRQQRRR